MADKVRRNEHADLVDECRSDQRRIQAGPGVDACGLDAVILAQAMERGFEIDLVLTEYLKLDAGGPKALMVLAGRAFAAEDQHVAPESG